MMKKMFAASLLLGAGLFALADSKGVVWKDGDVKLKGTMFLPAKRLGTSPGVLVFPDWLGAGEDAKMRASQLAGQGYVALVVDMYGEGKVLSNAEQAKAETAPFYADRKKMVARAKAAYDALARREEVDPKKIAAVGFCFGGTTALQLARSGADLKGAVSLHGGLGTDAPADAATLKARILVLHGGLDPRVPPAEVAAFFDEMNRAKASWDFTAYGGAVHAFTKKAAGNDPSKGAAYDERAARLAWKATADFLADLFPAPAP